MPQLLSILHTIFVMGIVLGLMILIHEFGHFAVAKYFGVRVEVFSIGFGKRLLGFTKGETDYRISAIPLGGYVKMAALPHRFGRAGDEHHAGRRSAYGRVYGALRIPRFSR